MQIGSMHPLIVGLVWELPEPGTPMHGDRHQDWLNCAAHILGLLYPEPYEPGANLNIEPQPAAQTVPANGGRESSVAPEAVESADNSPETANEVQVPLGVPPADPLRSEGATHEDASTAAPEHQSTAALKEVHGLKVSSDSAPVRTLAGSEASSPLAGGKAEPGAGIKPRPSILTQESEAVTPATQDVSAASSDESAQASEPPPMHESLATGEAGSSVSPVKSRKKASGRLQKLVVSIHEEHPDWTATQIAAAAGSESKFIYAVAKRLDITLPKALVGRPRLDASPVASVPKPVAARTIETPPAVKFEPRTEPGETAARRREVVALHTAEPTLTANDAAARLAMPFINLRIFTAELGIAWAVEPSNAAGKGEASAPSLTVRERVHALHRMHPNWGAGLVSKELGCAYGTASTYLAEARRFAREAA